jgi:endonuclease YncB( thermonuclease family)
LSEPAPKVTGVRIRPVLLGCLLLAACASPSTTSTSATASSGLLHAAPHGDGDSWKDTQGREYRLGLVNTPELNECFGETARKERQALVANGFRAQTYQTDRYGRRVSVVTLADGRNLNVYLARHGYANDRYLNEFRSENPSLARELDVAFAAARAERAGLWGACPSTR